MRLHVSKYPYAICCFDVWVTLPYDLLCIRMNPCAFVTKPYASMSSHILMHPYSNHLYPCCTHMHLLFFPHWSPSCHHSGRCKYLDIWTSSDVVISIQKYHDPPKVWNTQLRLEQTCTKTPNKLVLRERRRRKDTATHKLSYSLLSVRGQYGYVSG